MNILISVFIFSFHLPSANVLIIAVVNLNVVLFHNSCTFYSKSFSQQETISGNIMQREIYVIYSLVIGKLSYIFVWQLCLPLNLTGKV